MKHPNELVQMDTKGPFYLKASRTKHYFIHAIDDCSRKVVSHSKPMKLMHDGGKEFTSTDFANFLFIHFKSGSSRYVLQDIFFKIWQVL
jgi:hypothetical protein